MNTVLTQLDDLTMIKGIGPTRQAWLRSRFQVHTCGDLAALVPDKVEAKLKTEKQIVSRTEIESWIVQAQALVTAATRSEIEAQIAAAPATLPATTLPGTDLATAPVSNHLVKGKASQPSTPASAWKATARFVVEFQANSDEPHDTARPLYRTIANHLDLVTDHLLDSQSWPGLERDLLCTWMLAQMNPLPPALGLAALSLAKPTPSPLFQIKITQLRLFQPLDAQFPRAISKNDTQPSGLVAEHSPFALEVAFELMGSAAGSRGAQLRYAAQFHLRDLLTGASINLGETATYLLAANQTIFTARLPNVVLPASLYRLQVLVSLQSRPLSLGYFEVPLLQIL